MRHYKLAFYLTALISSWGAEAQVKLYLSDTISPIGVVSTDGGAFSDSQGACLIGTNRFVWRTLSTTQGSSAVSQTFNPANGTPPCLMQTANGNGDYLMFLSPPVSAQVTIQSTDTITYNLYCVESATQLNGGFRMRLYRWSRGGVVSLIAQSQASNECATSLGVQSPANSGSPAATTLNVGDRLAVFVEIVSGASVTFNGSGSRTITFRYGRDAGNNADTWVNISRTVSFSADASEPRPTVN